MKVNARKIALSALDMMTLEHLYVKEALERTLSVYAPDPIDRRFCVQLVYGVVENRLYLDYYIRALSSVPFRRIEVSVLNILRMALYQLIFLSKVPESAAVNEAVHLAKRLGKRQAGFVNAILRQYLRRGTDLTFPAPEVAPVEFLSLTYSHPEWLVRRWMTAHGFDETERMLEANNRQPALSLRINRRRTTRRAFGEMLSERGIAYRNSEMTSAGIVIEHMKDYTIAELPGYSEGLFQIQDESSMCAVECGDIGENMRVLDVCAAPGGKAIYASEFAPGVRVDARDVSAAKRMLLAENIDRMHASDRICVEVSDARLAREADCEQYDRVFVDAPCSGLGIIRRKPDIRYAKTESDIVALSALQKEILRASSRAVANGGKLIYSTCTLTPEENEENVEWFLKVHPSFALDAHGMRTFYPHIHGCDGFFIAVFEKI